MRRACVRGLCFTGPAGWARVGAWGDAVVEGFVGFGAGVVVDEVVVEGTCWRRVVVGGGISVVGVCSRPSLCIWMKAAGAAESGGWR